MGQFDLECTTLRRVAMGYQMSLVSVQGRLCPGVLCRETPPGIRKVGSMHPTGFQKEIELDVFECSDWSPLGLYRT